VMAVSEPFLLSTHTLRPDIQVVTLALAALSLVEYGLANGAAWPCLLAGVLLGLSADTHLNSLGFMPLVAAAPIVRFGWGVWRRPPSWLIGAGLGLALAYYLAVRVLPDPAGYATAARYWIGVDKAPPLVRAAGGPLSQLELEALRYADYFGLSPQGIEEPAELALIVAGVGAAIWRAARGSGPDRTLLLGLMAAMIFFVVAVSTKSRYYMLLTYATYALLIARTFQTAAQRVRRWVPAPAALAAFLLVTVVAPLKVQDRAWDKYVRGVRYRAGQEYYALTAQLEQLAGPGAKVLAPPLYWFGLHDDRFVDIFVFERVKRQCGMTAPQFLQEIRPDLVITDAKIATDRATEHELYRALDELASHEQIVRHKNYGDVAIYRLTW